MSATALEQTDRCERMAAESDGWERRLLVGERKESGKGHRVLGHFCQRFRRLQWTECWCKLSADARNLWAAVEQRDAETAPVPQVCQFGHKVHVPGN